MFQTFDVKSDPESAAPRLVLLRARMKELGLDALYVPHTDEHQNEYLPAFAERLAWLTGFTGSAGAAIITDDRGHLFVDGRYTLQARAQTNPDLFDTHDLIAEGPHKWIGANLSRGQSLAVDPWLHTIAEGKRLRDICSDNKIELIELDANLIDEIWADQPAAPSAPVAIHPRTYAGVSAKRKLSSMAAEMRSTGAQATVITDTSSICWMFNIRGGDVPRTPLVLANAILPARGAPQLFVSTDKLGIEQKAYLTQLADLNEPAEFRNALATLGTSAKKILLDETLAPMAVASIVREGGATVVPGTDPARLPRARKNMAEKRGTRQAHRRDGAAMVSFLAWLDTNINAPGLDEIKIATELEEARRATGERLGMPLLDISFESIVGTGPNGAIVHYRVNMETNRAVQAGDLILIDSGGQYHDGTTDITRVIPAGEVDDEKKRHFTLVLKGMIAISLAAFPSGTRGMDIDVLARNALWQAGHDYAHGTGHGVGSYLGVHEGPQNISKRGIAPLEAGMIVSNEPGCYVTDSHGIRIENLVLVKPAKVSAGGTTAMHEFETLTLCPIDRRMIMPKMLTRQERRWLNRYHARVRRELTPLIEDQPTIEWLNQATARL